jgi:hypothetical protein
MGVPSARAWHAEGHQAISAAAAEALPSDVPAFLRQGGGVLAQDSVDPDLVRVGDFKALAAAKSSDHYFDIEPLEPITKDTFPPDRYRFIALLQKKHINPRDIGMGLYALQETRQKLTIALAEYRKWPDNQAIQAKCLVYAGEMAHYAEDLCQPLHTTVRFDGQLDAQGRTSHSGIHEKVDGLLRYLSEDQRKLPVGARRNLQLGPDIWSLYQVILATHQQVDRVYELEPLLPDRNHQGPLDPKVLAFAKERFEAGVLFTASLIDTAWRDSATVKLPAWLDRPAR